MRKSKPQPYLLLFGAVLLLLSAPALTSERVRGALIGAICPLMVKISETDFFIRNAFEPTISVQTAVGNVTKVTAQEEIQRLELENKLLYAELVQLRDLVENHEAINPAPQAIPARVIFRTPNSWHSSLWINLGYRDNERLPSKTIARNSPVLVGDSIIGVIDYVGRHQSRVRLITDSGLTPSVRVLRKVNQQAHYLAKGELRGAGNPLWRANGQTLRGIGFNYDFSDEKGPARDLRSGEATEKRDLYPAMTLLRVDDLLVTTGMDGVFPPDLNVAKVTKIYPLKEGDYYYEIEAEPTAGQLDELSLVFVLPPIGYDADDQPPVIGR